MKAHEDLTVSAIGRFSLPLEASPALHWHPQEQEWEVAGEEACLASRAGLPLPGWYMIELTVERSVTMAAASFRFETREAAFHIDMPLRIGKVTKRLVHVPVGCRRLVFFPMNVDGRFRVHHFKMTWLTPGFVHDRLMRRLGSMHHDYRRLDKAQIRRRLRAKAKRLGQSWRRTALEDYETTFVSLCSHRNYRLWIDKIEGRRQPSAEAAADEIAALSSRPRVTALVVVDAASDSAAVAASLDSLAQQAYGDWQALVVPRTGLALESHRVVARRAEADPRVRLLPVQAGPLVAQLREAVVAADGELVVGLSAGDRLSPQACHRVAVQATHTPALELLYCDDDRLDDQGLRHSPRFKPEWNPDLLLAQPYVGRAVFFRRGTLDALLTDAGQGLSSLDLLCHELLLRFMERHGDATPGLTERLAKVLFHRRERGGETPTEALGRLVQAHLDRQGSDAEALAGQLPDGVHVRWRVPQPPPLVSLLVPTRDGIEILQPCVDAILERTDYPNLEVLILDNQSSCPRTLAYMARVAEDPRVRVLRWDHPFNYSAINNFGARQARGSLIGLINNDVEPIDGDWLGEMVGHACRPEIGCVGAKLYYSNGTVQHGGVILGVGGVAGHAHRFFQHDEDGHAGRLKLTQNLSAVTAACLLVRKAVFDEVGGLNEPDLAVTYNDVDLCLKVREAGYRNLWTPHAELYHHESVSRGSDDNPRKRARSRREADYMNRTWGRLLDRDPAYNHNLTLVHEDFSLR